MLSCNDPSRAARRVRLPGGLVGAGGRWARGTAVRMWRRSVGMAAGLVGLLVLAGCDLVSQQKVNEESESHYQDGLVSLRLMDYDGAIRHFEDALQVNPNSGAAHFELGHLFSEKRTNDIRALYHYQRYRELRPKDTNFHAVVEGRIFHCKIRLAQEFAAFLDQGHQNQHVATIEKLRQQLNQREIQIAELNYRLSLAPRASAPAVPEGSTGTAGPAVGPVPVPALALPQSNQLTPLTRAPSVRAASAPAPAAASGSGSGHAGVASGVGGGGAVRAVPPASVAVRRTHRVQSGETLARIAARYGVPLGRLQSANPRIDPRRLRPGTELVVPER